MTMGRRKLNHEMTILDLYAPLAWKEVLDRAAQAEDRSRSSMIRHLVAEGMRSRGILPELVEPAE
jgi:hypothetical protein